MPARDPDENAVVMFRHHASKDELASLREGRPIYNDVEVCEIRFPGSMNMSVFPSMAFSHWENDRIHGGQNPVTYAERFAHQYRQFKEQQAQTKVGTPLQHAPFLTEARRAELRAMNVYTVEQLSIVDGQELKNLGPHARELKNMATEYIAESKTDAPAKAMAAEVEALRAQNDLMKEDLQRLMERNEKDNAKVDERFENMTLDQLREFITTRTGHAPHGALNRKTLTRMAVETAAAQ